MDVMDLESLESGDNSPSPVPKEELRKIAQQPPPPPPQPPAMSALKPPDANGGMYGGVDGSASTVAPMWVASKFQDDNPPDQRASTPKATDIQQIDQNWTDFWPSTAVPQPKKPQTESEILQKVDKEIAIPQSTAHSTLFDTWHNPDTHQSDHDHPLLKSNAAKTFAHKDLDHLSEPQDSETSATPWQSGKLDVEESSAVTTEKKAQPSWFQDTPEPQRDAKKNDQPSWFQDTPEPQKDAKKNDQPSWFQGTPEPQNNAKKNDQPSWFQDTPEPQKDAKNGDMFSSQKSLAQESPNAIEHLSEPQESEPLASPWKSDEPKNDALKSENKGPPEWLKDPQKEAEKGQPLWLRDTKEPQKDDKIDDIFSSQNSPAKKDDIFSNTQSIESKGSDRSKPDDSETVAVAYHSQESESIQDSHTSKQDEPVESVPKLSNKPSKETVPTWFDFGASEKDKPKDEILSLDHDPIASEEPKQDELSFLKQSKDEIAHSEPPFLDTEVGKDDSKDTKPDDIESGHKSYTWTNSIDNASLTIQPGSTSNKGVSPLAKASTHDSEELQTPFPFPSKTSTENAAPLFASNVDVEKSHHGPVEVESYSQEFTQDSSTSKQSEPENKSSHQPSNEPSKETAPSWFNSGNGVTDEKKPEDPNQESTISQESKRDEVAVDSTTSDLKQSGYEPSAFWDTADVPKDDSKATPLFNWEADSKEEPKPETTSDEIKPVPESHSKESEPNGYTSVQFESLHKPFQESQSKESEHYSYTSEQFEPESMHKPFQESVSQESEHYSYTSEQFEPETPSLHKESKEPSKEAAPPWFDWGSGVKDESKKDITPDDHAGSVQPSQEHQNITPSEKYSSDSYDSSSRASSTTTTATPKESSSNESPVGMDSSGGQEKELGETGAMSSIEIPVVGASVSPLMSNQQCAASDHDVRSTYVITTDFEFKHNFDGSAHDLLHPQLLQPGTASFDNAIKTVTSGTVYTPAGSSVVILSNESDAAPSQQSMISDGRFSSDKKSAGSYRSPPVVLLTDQLFEEPSDSVLRARRMKEHEKSKEKKLHREYAGSHISCAASNPSLVSFIVSSTKKVLQEKEPTRKRQPPVVKRPIKPKQKRMLAIEPAKKEPQPPKQTVSKRPTKGVQPKDGPTKSVRPTKAVQPKDRPTKPLQSKDRPAKRLQSKDRPAKRLQSKDRPTKRLQSKDRPTKRLQSKDRPTKRVQPKQLAIKPKPPKKDVSAKPKKPPWKTGKPQKEAKHSKQKEADFYDLHVASDKMLKVPGAAGPHLIPRTHYNDLKSFKPARKGRKRSDLAAAIFRNYFEHKMAKSVFLTDGFADGAPDGFTDSGYLVPARPKRSPPAPKSKTELPTEPSSRVQTVSQESLAVAVIESPIASDSATQSYQDPTPVAVISEPFVSVSTTQSDQKRAVGVVSDVSVASIASDSATQRDEESTSVAVIPSPITTKSEQKPAPVKQKPAPVKQIPAPVKQKPAPVKQTSPAVRRKKPLPKPKPPRKQLPAKKKPEPPPRKKAPPPPKKPKTPEPVMVTPPASDYSSDFEPHQLDSISEAVDEAAPSKRSSSSHHSSKRSSSTHHSSSPSSSSTSSSTSSSASRSSINSLSSTDLALERDGWEGGMTVERGQTPEGEGASSGGMSVEDGFVSASARDSRVISKTYDLSNRKLRKSQDDRSH